MGYILAGYLQIFTVMATNFKFPQKFHKLMVLMINVDSNYILFFLI